MFKIQKRRKEIHPKSRVLILFTILCCLVLVASAVAQEIHFRFNPSYDVYISTYKNTRIVNMGELGAQTRVSKAKVKITIDKTPQGYSVIEKPISFTMTQDGQPVEDPITSFVQNMTLTYELDAEGQLLEMRGFEGLIEKLEESLPIELPPQMASLLNEETLVNKSIQEWNARVGSFIGVDVEIGDVWAGVEEVPLPFGGESMKFYSVTKFAEQVMFDNVDCVRLEFAFNTDAEELKDFMGDMLEALTEIVETEETPSVTNSEVVGKGERIIDPTTMLIYSETVERTIKTAMTVPGRGAVEMIVVEKREYGYEKIAP